MQTLRDVIGNDMRDVELGDERLKKRAKTTLEAMAERPGAGLSAQMKSWADLKGAYRFLSNPAVSRLSLEKPHFEATLELAKDREEPVLFIQDTTEFDFTGRKTAGVGPIGNHKGSGFFAHNCLALDVEGVPLGLAWQKTWARDAERVWRKTETRSQRQRRKGKQSDVWAETLREIGEPGEGRRFVSVSDREGDNFDYWRSALASGWHILTRVYVERSLANGEKSLRTLKALAAMGETEISLRAREGKAGGKIRLSLSWMQAEVKSPKNESGGGCKKPLRMSFVRCWNEEAELDWMLAVSWEVENEAEAKRCVEWYERRWTIEEFHKALKTGCGFERNQLESMSAMENLLAFHSILAARMLFLAKLSRTDKERLAAGLVDDELLEMISNLSDISSERMTLHEFTRFVAMKGGFIGRRSDGEPGWLTIAKGMTFILTLFEGWKAAKKCG